MSTPAVAAGAEASRPLAGDAVTVTVFTLLSRITGFVRVFVLAAVIGYGALGDTYGAANIVPNLLFELTAGGALQAVLVPALVAARREGGDRHLGEVAGSVLGVIVAAMAALALVVMVAAPLVAPPLIGDREKAELFTPMLVVFAPQVLFYGIGLVATAALAARRRFVAAAIAPAINNAVVVTACGIFWVLRDGRPADLHLSPLQFAVLAGGTTLGVVAFTALPGVVLSFQGVRWRPRWRPGAPELRPLRGAFGWAALSVAGTLAPTAAAVVLGYGATGGVAVFAMAFTFFLLPHSLIAAPAATTMAPRLADSWQRGDLAGTRRPIDQVLTAVVPLLTLTAAAMVALAWPIARLAAWGEASVVGPRPLAHTVAVLGGGVVSYGVAFVMTRILFSVGDVRAAALLVSVAAALGVAAMVVASAVADPSERAAAMAAGYALSQTFSAVLLAARVRRVTGSPSRATLLRLLVAVPVVAVAVGGPMAALASRFGPSRTASVVALVASGTVGLVVFSALAMAATGGPAGAMAAVRRLRGRS